ncbi:TPM domain-containing protein [Flavicella sediminum]|uniref:TPM domain-containing protein n=1 Tax=Flavicella sediminum TaxID=2585141 RepID=UPI001FB7585F|nr:TPM domain-containing protein [Flavicella sediminum]
MKPTNFHIFTLFVLLFVGMSFYGTAQQSIPEKPKVQTSVYDDAKLLNAQQKKQLEQKLIRYSDSTSTQLVVLTLTTIGSNDIAMFATEIAHKWGIGLKGKDNGVLVLVAKNQRKVTIATGYGIEHKLTDALSRRIIENIIKPEFKTGDFYAGLDKGTSVIIDILSGTYKASPKNTATENNSSAKSNALLVVVVIVIILFFVSRNRGGGGGRGNRNVSSDILTAILFSSMGRSSGGFGSSSGGFGGSSGGFGGGFGGGGFGGGGASGSW